MLGRKRILAVDPDEFVLIQLERLLEDAGFDTTTTWDARHALSLIGGEDFDCVLLCDHPPEVNAKDLLIRMRNLGRFPSCIVLQPAAAIHAAEFTQLGALDVVCRWSFDDLLHAIHLHLGPKTLAATA